MKIRNPFGMAGVIDIEGLYRVSTKNKKMVKFGLTSKGATDKGKFDWDSFKTVELFVAVEYELTVPPGFWDAPGPPGTGEGKFGLSADWDASFSDKGLELTQDGVQPRDWGPQSGGNEAVVVGVSARLSQSKPADKTYFVEMVVDILAGFTKDGFSLGMRMGVGSAGISITGKKGAGKDQLGLRLILDTKKPEPERPKKPVPKIDPGLVKRSVYFEKKDEDKLPSSSLAILDKWVNEIERVEDLQLVITMGELDIYLEGNTSKSGSKDYNAKLAKRRIESVVYGLNRRFGSTKVSYKKDPKAQSKYELEDDYRVDIYFDKRDASEAIVKRNGYENYY